MSVSFAGQASSEDYDAVFAIRSRDTLGWLIVRKIYQKTNAKRLADLIRALDKLEYMSGAEH